MSDEQQKDESWRGKVGRMSEEECVSFFDEGPLCRLGCHDEDGWPYVVPIWFLYKDGGYYLIPRERSAWARYLDNDERVYLTIDEPGSLRKVMVKGTARKIEGPNVGGKWVGLAEEMSTRYLGPDGPKYLVPTLHEPRWLFFVEPIKTTTWQGVDWAPKYKHSEWGEAKKGE